ncbi:hypothetical protein EVAR_91534_1 [Eumeta japonica]|uniref:Uncharacterized protein n=1 Tax=Eumeta variegata TaxID=151549 RepID=A0A4C1VCF6_EUMVA|nr:hypothetical protein EVAR_91534_1 [Eumeta japonica]
MGGASRGGVQASDLLRYVCMHRSIRRHSKLTAPRLILYSATARRGRLYTPHDTIIETLPVSKRGRARYKQIMFSVTALERSIVQGYGPASESVHGDDSDRMLRAPAAARGVDHCNKIYTHNTVFVVHIRPNYSAAVSRHRPGTPGVGRPQANLIPEIESSRRFIRFDLVESTR